MAGGSLSRALRLHQANWINRRNWLINEMETLSTASINRLLAFGEQLSKNKKDLQDSLEVMTSWLRDLVVSRLNPERVVNQDLAPRIRQVSQQMSIDVLVEKIDTIQAAQNAIQAGTNLRLALEAMVLKLSKS
jgi:DNA polymerase-3 subunit delta'